VEGVPGFWLISSRKDSVISLVPLRNSLRARPIPRPMSGRREGPKTSSATTAITIRCHGCNPNGIAASCSILSRQECCLRIIIHHPCLGLPWSGTCLGAQHMDSEGIAHESARSLRPARSLAQPVSVLPSSLRGETKARHPSCPPPDGHEALGFQPLDDRSSSRARADPGHISRCIVHPRCLSLRSPLCGGARPGRWPGLRRNEHLEMPISRWNPQDGRDTIFRRRESTATRQGFQADEVWLLSTPVQN